jgi:NADH-quinone oxidoreductase subunit K
MHLAYPAVLSALLFCTGLYGVLARRNAILVLMSVELMLNAVNLNLVAFDVWLDRAARDRLHSGQALTLFTIAIAAAEIGIGLAIVLAVHRNRGTADIDRLRDTAETPGPDDGPDGPDGQNDDDRGPAGSGGPGGLDRPGGDDPDNAGNADHDDSDGPAATAAQKAEATA